uniref:Uncharacterized protein n=1 Tax=Panagrolaimus sp. ES5 TaxID=591445 RepID=A0AC34FSA8_9BILA
MSTLKRAIKKKKVDENLPIVAASSSAYSFRERPKENDASSFSLRKLQNHEASLNSKTPVTSTTHLGRTVAATSSSVFTSENNGTFNKNPERPTAASFSTYLSRKRPLQKAPTASSSSMLNSRNGDTGNKKQMGDAFDQMDDISKNSNLPGPMEEIFLPEENDVSQGLNDNVSQPEKDTVSASLSDNAANPKKDDGTTRSSLVPKSKSFNVAEMRAMFAECDANKFKMYQRMYRMETQVIKNAYRLKYIALRTAANPHDLSVFTEPPVEFE